MPDTSQLEAYTFAYSSALDFPVSIRINHLDGHQPAIPASVLLKRPDLRHIGSHTNPASDLFVTAQLWADGKPLTVLVQTRYRAFKAARAWNEWLTLPITYANLPATAQIAVTIWDLAPSSGGGTVGHAVPFGGTTLPVFGGDGALLKGRQRCCVHRRRRADGQSATSTPHAKEPRRKGRRNSADRGEPGGEPGDKQAAEIYRLEELMKKHEMGEIPKNQWLDSMVYRHIEQLHRSESRRMSKMASNSASRDDTGENGASLPNDYDPGHFTLYVDYPRFDHPVVFTDHEYPAPPISTLAPQPGSSSNVQLKPPPEVTLGPGINDNDAEAGRLVRVFDPEVGTRENPVESKHRRLVRNQRTGVLDRDLKPNAKIRDELSNIVSYGPTQELKPEEKDVIWKFRHHLTRNRRALTKFVKSVAWTDAGEARQAVQLLPKWTEIDVDDALELLGPTFVHPAVRMYAVGRLRKADDDELLLYLLQLVQALKFDAPVPPDAAAEAAGGAPDSSLAQFLIARAVANATLGNFLHWYLMVECDDQSAGQSAAHRRLFARVSFDFMTRLAATPGGPAQRRVLLRQGELMAVLSKISKDVRFAREDRPRKIVRLKQALADPANELLAFDPPLPLPLDPSVRVAGILPGDANVFKSSLFPLLLSFRTAGGAPYPVIFKTGDDLRQDQLVIQIVMLMDRLLRKENLDLKLTPYRILATAPLAGAVQFVPSTPLAAIVAAHKGPGPALLAFLRAHNPAPAAPHGVAPAAMDTYVKSCAGYCVITYLLGVGDRHLDNLLLTPEGRFLHADFGYILGRDPKPFAPPMKLSREMIEGMGGAAGPAYAAFRQHCFTAFLTLRKSSGLILNLFSLMVDANIPDIRMEPDKAVAKVRERFHLELRSDEEAIRLFDGLMEDSVGAVLPALIDWSHTIVQRFRT